ncbi:ThuA domain-containing protein [Niabella ginsengisoli]|uniref:ThuA domain-containing protein n=1 Tax=Niabella ginsengisoli TaxID=522298 RepID=A0ABS9SI64_9BACT|nr:ThuA domain-containing protein [Niabella ginsengisoli]MCH5598073.1 ThuA domain-containing protein [Niabella ginsengisoli]
MVYKKNGKGFIHDNVPYAAQAIIDLGKKHGFKVDTSSNPSMMTENNLKQYRMLIFTSTNNDVFDTDAQRLAFRRYIEAGGGFVGVHSVTGTERNWEWFKMLLGGTFLWHAKGQNFTIKVIDPKHPSMKNVPAVWERHDECYFAKEIYPGTRTIMVNDFSTLDTSQIKTINKNAGFLHKYVPSAWFHDFDGGTTWCTTLGHSKESYSDPTYLKLIMGGIEYVANTAKKIDFSKAYAKTFNEPVRY